MKIQILSDLHLEFDYREYEFSNCDLLILAGDIYSGTKGVEWIKNKVTNIPVIYVMGNHEYYNNYFPSLLDKCKEIAKESNIHVLENESITINNITFHCATLWTDFELFNNSSIAQFECERCMNDYHCIRLDTNSSKLRADITRQIHHQTKKWLNKSLTESKTDKNIVITHHAPTIHSIATRFKDSLLSTGFASNLEDLIINKEPNLWVHGHVHDAIDCYVGKTRILCNPCGYPHENSNGYIDDLIIEI
ncbi:phosphoesterase [Thiospirochaeta perfilievii]|uniref:Phosphoesterase n=1 Tax=Thiospirochaeta perfilievii TaxID=252967 RepID=A0A5C1Q7E5_9SPIO|nr:metallophosphoesterase [Thiospirochaeta perfilievii]QEN03351.1 phosphoesterase [Thiospirochaeta perfilievii]